MFILHIETFRSHNVDVLCFSSVPVIAVLNVIDCSSVLEYINNFSYLSLLKELRKTHSNFGIFFTSQHAQIFQIFLLLCQMKVFQ